VAAASPAIVLLSPGTIVYPVAPGTLEFIARPDPFKLLLWLVYAALVEGEAVGVGEAADDKLDEDVPAQAAVPNETVKTVNAVIIRFMGYLLCVDNTGTSEPTIQSPTGTMSVGDAYHCLLPI
jgi:hypothetical protein